MRTFLFLSSVVITALLHAEAPKSQPVLQKYIDEKEIAGGVIMAMHNGKVILHQAEGFRDLEAAVPMQRDDLFWIASMTKPMTAVALMMLVDEGKLSIDDPVSKFIPAVGDVKIMVNGQPVAPQRAITVKDLLMHTGGLGQKEHEGTATLEQRAKADASAPLTSQPGEKWAYCNPGINMLGRIIEVVSGTDYATFMQQRIFEPCGMKNTTFWPTLEQQKSMAKSYELKDGKLHAVIPFFIKGILEDPQRTAIPAGGLYSTAADCANFYVMMAQGGMFGEKRLLKAETVRLMTTTQTGELETGFTAGMSWGLGFQVVKNPQGVTERLSPGTYGHGGAYGTGSWHDPVKNITYILMIQRQGFPNADASEVRRHMQSFVETLTRPQ